MPDPTVPVRHLHTVHLGPNCAIPNAKVGPAHLGSIPDFRPPERVPGLTPTISLVLHDVVGVGWLQTFGGPVKRLTRDCLVGCGLRHGEST